jgi:hypothetical protein
MGSGTRTLRGSSRLEERFNGGSSGHKTAYLGRAGERVARGEMRDVGKIIACGKSIP